MHTAHETSNISSLPPAPCLIYLHFVNLADWFQIDGNVLICFCLFVVLSAPVSMHIYGSCTDGLERLHESFQGWNRKKDRLKRTQLKKNNNKQAELKEWLLSTLFFSINVFCFLESKFIYFFTVKISQPLASKYSKVIQLVKCPLFSPKLHARLNQILRPK